MKRFSPLIACLFTLGGLLLASCEPRVVRPADPPGKFRVALIMKSLANEFFQTMEKGAVAHQQKFSDVYDLISQGIKDELDVNGQIQLVEQMIAQKVSAIVIAPADSKALVAVCKKASESGIIVVNIDNRFDADVLAEKGITIPFVGPDNRKGARMVGEYLSKRLKPGDPVAIIEGVSTAFNGQQRKLGFEDAMREAGMKVVASQSAQWEMARAHDVVSALLAEHPDLKALLCANDSMALGAVAALKETGKQKKVLVVGYDSISAVGDLIRNGEMLATVDQHAAELAAFGIDYALMILRANGIAVDRETEIDLITSADAP